MTERSSKRRKRDLHLISNVHYQKQLEKSKSHFKRLRHISLCSNGLKKIPEEVFKCKELSYLNVSKNEITTIPDDIIECKFLQRFWARGNKINYITPRIKDMKILYEIGLKDNFVPVRFQDYPTIDKIQKRLNDISLYYENLNCALHILWCAKQLKDVLPMDVWKLIAKQILFIKIT